MKTDLVAFALALTFAVPASTGEAPAPCGPASAPGDRPRIGLVLSGGGARGAAHVGVLEVLDELRVPVDCIVGTSMGSIVGGLYAAGMSPTELRRVVTETEWASLFRDRPDRAHRYFRRKEDDIDFPVRYKLHLKGRDARLPLGVLQGQRLTNRLDRFELLLDPPHDFDRFPIPFRAVATDLDTGEAHVFDGGSLARAQRASMSIPGVFRPVEIDGRLYVDGGVVANLPVGVMRAAFDVDAVIAVDISTPLREAEIESYLAVIRRMMRFLTQGNVARDHALLGETDFLLMPDLGDLATADFERSAEAIDVGRAAALAAADALRRYAIPEETYLRHRERRMRELQPAPIVVAVRAAESGPLAPEVVEAFVSQPRGQPLDADRLETDLVRLHGIGVHDPIDFETVPAAQTAEGAELEIFAPRARVGLQTVQFGLEIEDDFEGGNAFTLAARHQRLGVNRRGAEWRNEARVGDLTGLSSEFYQPLDRGLHWFVAPRALFARENTPIFVDGQAVADLRFTVWGGGIDLGRNLGTWGELRAGFERLRGEIDIAVGAPLPLDDRLQIATWGAQLRIDTLDSPTWPTRGALGRVEWDRRTSALGGETEGETLRVDLDWAFPAGRFRLVPGLRLGFDLEPSTGAGGGFDLGGLLRLSGYAPLERIGAERAFGRLVVFRRLDRSVLNLVPAGWYAGLSIETGEVFEAGTSIDTSEFLWGGAVFLGADTPLGPLLLGYGYAEPDRDRIYFSFGRFLFRD